MFPTCHFHINLRKLLESWKLQIASMLKLTHPCLRVSVNCHLSCVNDLCPVLNISISINPTNHPSSLQHASANQPDQAAPAFFGCSSGLRFLVLCQHLVGGAIEEAAQLLQPNAAEPHKLPQFRWNGDARTRPDV